MRKVLPKPLFAALALLLDDPIDAEAASAKQSGPVAISGDNNLLVNVNPESNSITIFNVSGANLTKTNEITTGREPTSVAIHPTQHTAYVANAASGTVVVVNLDTATITRTITVGQEPMAVAVSPNGTRLYVANSSSNTLSVIDTTNFNFVATVDLSASGSAPRAISVTNDGDADDTDETVFVAEFFAQLRPGKTSNDEGQDDQREGRVVAISAATNTVLGTAVLGPMDKTFNGNLGTGFNANGQLAPGGPPTGNPANPTAAIPSLNPQAFVTPTGAFPNQLAAIALHPTNGFAYVVSTGASPNGPPRFNQMAQGLVSVFNIATRAEFTSGQTGAGVRQTAPLNLNQGVNLGTTPAPRLFLTNPLGMVWRPDGSDAWVVIQESDLLVRLVVDGAGIPTVNNPLVAGPSNLVRVDLQGNPPQIAGKAPRGLVINSTGTRAYVYNFVSRSVTAVDISVPTSPTIAATAQASALPAPNTAQATVQLGAEMFFTGRGPQNRMSSESWGSCAVCHPGGRSDNVTWMFDTGPRQTISLDGTFARGDTTNQRILNWSATRDEVHDFELNTRNVFGGRGLIEEDRLFFALGGTSGATPDDSTNIEQFQQFTGAVGANNSRVAGNPFLPQLPEGRRDFATATLGDGRILIIGGRAGAGQGLALLINPVLMYDPRTNDLTVRAQANFTQRHSLGAAAVKVVGGSGYRVYAIGGYTDTNPASNPVPLVQEYNPDTDTWRTVASLPTPVAQFGITVAGGINTAEPLELIHVVSGNGASENTPSVVGGGSIVQRFQPDPVGPGTWSAFSVAGLTPRRNHGAATALRVVQSRVFVIGGQDAGGTVLGTVEEYAAQAVVAIGPTTPPGAPFFGPHPPRTSLPSPRARFGIGHTLTSNQIYVMGGVDGAGADQTTIFEYSAANNTATGNPGTPTGAWVTRGNLSVARRGLGVSTPPGVTNLLPVRNAGRDAIQDAIEAWVAQAVRTTRPPVSPHNAAALQGKTLFNQTGLVTASFSCATCHGGPKFTRSIADFPSPPSAEVGLGLGNERVIAAELRQTATQPNQSTPPFAAGTFPGVLVNVNTFAPNSAGGRVNELRASPADISQAIAPLGPNGFNIPSLLSVHETAPYFYNGLAQTLDQVLDGSQDGAGNPSGTRHHFVPSASDRAALVAYLKSISTGPTAITNAASSITTTSAQLNGTGNANNLLAAASFEYGLDTNYGNTTASQPLGNGSADVPVNATVGGLTPATLYHYRLVVTNTDATDFGDDLTFTTAAPPTPTPTATATATPTPTPTATPTATPQQLLNISTRARVQSGENVLIGGFIIRGTAPKKIIVRGIGPSLSSLGIQGVLADPTLELHNAVTVLAINDNWKDDQRPEIEASGVPPTNDAESAIVRTLPANNAVYTAILAGKNNSSGIGVFEAYDLDSGANSTLANISTRGLVQTGDNVMIGGFIAAGGNAKVLIRAIGPSLSGSGVANPLQDPTLELHDGNGVKIAENDDWRQNQEAEIQATGIPPSDNRESAIVRTLGSGTGSFTAIVRGKNNTVGVALVEIYNLQ